MKKNLFFMFAGTDHVSENPWLFSSWITTTPQNAIFILGKGIKTRINVSQGKKGGREQ